MNEDILGLEYDLDKMKKNIRDLMTDSHMTQEQLERKTGISQSRISKVLNSKKNSDAFTIQQLVSIAQVFGVSTDQMRIFKNMFFHDRNVILPDKLKLQVRLYDSSARTLVPRKDRSPKLAVDQRQDHTQGDFIREHAAFGSDTPDGVRQVGRDRINRTTFVFAHQLQR